MTILFKKCTFTLAKVFLQHSTDKRNLAFTLAEVLITLGIIGIVAALTLPTLIQSYKKQEASAKLKKVYSIISQAILLSENKNGSSKDWKQSGFLQDKDGNFDYVANGKISRAFFMKYLAPYIKYTKIEDAHGNTDESIGTGTIIYMADGTILELINSNTCVDFRVDINGKKAPNKKGVDIFLFLLCNDASFSSNYYCESRNKTFCAYFIDYKLDHSREKLLENCQNYPSTCSGLLQMDGWEFKDDYPYKL